MMRRAALAKSETYRTTSVNNFERDVRQKVKDLSDSTPVYKDNISLSLAKKQVDSIRSCLANSIVGKLKAHGGAETYESVLKFAETQEKTSPLS